MELFKRITDLMTPPPSKPAEFVKTSPPRPANPLVEDQGLTTAPLGEQVKKLVALQSVDDPQVPEILEEIKKIAVSGGLYVTASKIRIQLDSMPRVDPAKGTINWKDRGYVFAADLIYQHILRELRAMEAEQHAIGPNIFAGYFNELVACLLQGKNVRRAIELPVIIIESVIESAFYSQENRAAYLEMAEQGIHSVLTQATSKYEVDAREQAKRRTESRKTETPTPSETSPVHYLTVGTVTYVKDLEEAFARFRQGFGAYARTSVPRAALSKQPFDAVLAQQQLEYLAGVLKAAEVAAFANAAALVTEHIAQLYRPSNAAAHRELAIRAAERYDALGDKERALLFMKLCERRYTKAADLYAAASEADKANTVRQKIAKH
ncbi:MAG: hypothetical protein K1Y02_08440 [Candidatus Hydrogenedentes bacterium]|nr:hypothetical protein [Candidatus Hydrogenedentota bacterium]